MLDYAYVSDNIPESAVLVQQRCIGNAQANLRSIRPHQIAFDVQCIRRLLGGPLVGPALCNRLVQRYTLLNMFPLNDHIVVVSDNIAGLPTKHASKRLVETQDTVLSIENHNPISAIVENSS